MASRGEALPAGAASSTIDQDAKWFWNFLREELTPYPERAWVVGRMTLSVSIFMVLVMTFRIPNGFEGGIIALLISRENPRETFLAGLRTAVIFLIGTVYVVFSIRLLIGDPLTHFLWVAGTVFVFFYLLGIVVNYGSAGALALSGLGAIPLWDNNTLSVETRLENTLWAAGSVVLALVVTIIVEYVFRRVHPASDLAEGIQVRMETVENVLRSAAAERPVQSETEKKLSQYMSVGISRLRRLVLRSDSSPRVKEQMSTVISLVGRLVDIAGSFRLALVERAQPLDAADRSRCLRLADQIAVLRRNLSLKELPLKIEGSSQEEPSSVPFLQTMERTVALIPSAYAGSQSVKVLMPVDEEAPARIFVADALSNPAHVQFALRGTLAAMVCYITYVALDWPGLNTALITCFVTALSTIGSSRQKQVLRLGGVTIGGFIFGLGAQVFVLPYLDTIAGFTVLFAFVTAIAAWIQTSSARISYLGVQLALAFYLINLQEFTIQTSLSIARDRVFGVLLGVVSMGIFFDLLWVKNPLREMQAVFARNLEMFAELAEQLLVLEQDQIKALARILQLRDQLNAGFQAVTAQADAVLLEFGPSRPRKLEIREDMRRWQPAIRALLVVQVTAAQYLVQKPLTDLPERVAQAVTAFERDVAQVMRAMANEMNGNPVDAVPDIRQSFAQLQQGIQNCCQDLDIPVTPQESDVISLAESLASILAPLYEDIHATIARDKQVIGPLPQPRLKEA